MTSSYYLTMFVCQLTADFEIWVAFFPISKPNLSGISELICNPLWPPMHLYLPGNQKSFCFSWWRSTKYREVCKGKKKHFIHSVSFPQISMSHLWEFPSRIISTAYRLFLTVCGKSKRNNTVLVTFLPYSLTGVTSVSLFATFDATDWL